MTNSNIVTLTPIPKKTTPPSASVNIFAPDDDESVHTPALPSHMERDALIHYAGQYDDLIFHGFGPAFWDQPNVPDFEDLEGIKILTGQPIFLFMQAVRNDDLERAFTLHLTMGAQIRTHINQPSFFYFTGSSDVCFTTPAHLARSVEMAMALHRHFGSRFDIPDSQGRLPQFYWGRHSREALLFLYGEQYLNMDMSQGGRLTMVRDQLHNAPIWEAIYAQNHLAAKGLSLCATAGVNDAHPRDPTCCTPLMVQAAHTSEQAFMRHEFNARSWMRALKTTFGIARSPHLNWDRRDWESHTVMDLRLDDTVAKLLTRARETPWQASHFATLKMA